MLCPWSRLVFLALWRAKQRASQSGLRQLMPHKGHGRHSFRMLTDTSQNEIKDLFSFYIILVSSPLSAKGGKKCLYFGYFLALAITEQFINWLRRTVNQYLTDAELTNTPGWQDIVPDREPLLVTEKPEHLHCWAHFSDFEHNAGVQRIVQLVLCHKLIKVKTFPLIGLVPG